MIDDVLDALNRWWADGRAGALATVVRTSGSVPRSVGAKLAVGPWGELVGSVSGGCVEGDVARQATAVIATGQSTVTHYGISDDLAMTVGLMCGGEIDVLIEPMTPGLADQLRAFADEIEAGGAVTRVIDLDPARLGTNRIAVGVPALAATEVADTVEPANRLWIVGAGHVAEHTAVIAERCGFSVQVVDPRRLFAEQPRLEGLTVHVDWPDRVFAADPLQPRDAVAVLSHDPKIDEPALLAALRSPAFYVGALGSRSAQIQRAERLRGLGLSEDELARLHAPIGLDLGGGTPAEIALAIVAQVVAAAHGRRRAGG